MQCPCLESHAGYREPSKKVISIGTCIARLGMRQLVSEMDKCDVACANCHKVRKLCDEAEKTELPYHHPLGVPSASARSPPRVAFLAGVERLWPGPFAAQNENVG